MANSDNNWKQTRVTSEELSELLGIPVSTVENFFEVLENLILHKLLEEMGSGSTIGKDFEIILPYLGSVVISWGAYNRISYGFSLRTVFFRKLKKMHYTRTSPLAEQLCNLVSKDLLNKFDEGEPLDG